MRELLRPFLRPLLRRDRDEVLQRAAEFRIDEGRGRDLVRDLGHAFLDGYHAMLEARDLDEVARQGGGVAIHFRPFFFEGAAMGYLPRGWYVRGCAAQRVEADLLGMAPAYLYLYYVGLGFWYAFRHPRRPDRIAELAPHVDALYLPLCYDGFGFKLGFFDAPGDVTAPSRLDASAAGHAFALWQGFGRAQHFVFFDDEDGFRTLCAAAPAERRWDLEFGRSLARGFTGIDRPAALLAHLSAAADGDERSARLTGIAWAAAARRMNAPDYFAACLAGRGSAPFFDALAEVCEATRLEAAGYLDWQSRARVAVAELYERERPELEKDAEAG